MNHKEKPDVFGKCIACEKETAKKCPTCNVLSINEHYKARKFKLSDKSIMSVAFCDKCAELVKEEDFGWIMKNIILGWEETLKKGDQTEEQKKRIKARHESLKIIDFA